MLPKLPPGTDNGGRHADAAIPRYGIRRER
jgi:hypothetical protein